MPKTVPAPNVGIAQPVVNNVISPAEKEEMLMEKLQKLDDFYKKGLIDQEEYDAKKQDILKELSIADLKIKEFYRIKIGE